MAQSGAIVPALNNEGKNTLIPYESQINALRYVQIKAKV